MNNKVSKELSKHRLQQAKDDLRASEILYKENLYKSANNRAYYSIFHSIKAVLALEPIDFKRHKDIMNQFCADEKIDYCVTFRFDCTGMHGIWIHNADISFL